MQIITITVLFAFLIWVSIYDIRTHKIENYTHLIIITASFFINELTVTERIIGCVFCFVPLLIVNIFSKDGIGMGDVKLIGAFGFVLGVLQAYQQCLRD